ncbi:MAG: 4-(cytidine 5'-diphospho)-2-C-methyl-D-erythritol kinase [Deltaproteobacteria bacterium]|nr:4-(cytidine 5'-diphospho)-2-C-methyl-D-erythritol kinase [Deltaproteobacteria bacterium]MBW1928656.1 4-(cytidine 5'-diphospho)-2-C-methyl-D-erythritol kinase [Deltaproteobacteria bacterium]MBW2025809.1 4-(cytidine 5'-diphospho)-2-C-methyl-D-erythritol kinase [Deltaproteobacteria bacterium]MBW2125946.1 4-(cytidine 5'-diphospho)-2-C-methyl-D-erythritol kinase [Deltaproteobacteria bacterium]
MNTQIRDIESLVVKAPAKLNLILKVTGRRPDGYHDLFSIMVPVGVCDTIRLSPGEEGITIQCRGRDLPSDESNLVYRACECFFSAVGLKPSVHAVVDKVIPIAAGLAGGSSDAAATLEALNKIYGNLLDPQGLHKLARELGADVPFFLAHGPCVARGIGHVLDPIEYFPSFWYVIVSPPLQISTAWVYGQLKLELTQKSNNYIVEFSREMFDNLDNFLENDLETVVLPRFPEVQRVKALLLKAGAQGVLMSGSGPSVFGIFAERDSAIEAKRFLDQKRVGEVFVATTWLGEEKVSELGNRLSIRFS